ncbi:MAG: hypothetical protein NVS1B6_06400 [Steroidobacteraceae bacterium]
MIRVVGDAEVIASPISDAIHAAAAEAIAAGAVVVVLAYETPDSTIHMRTVPSSHAVLRGVVDQLYEHIHPLPDLGD